MMTPRQRDALDFIAAYIRTRGISPSYDEIMVGLGLTSKSGVQRLVIGLKRRGEIDVDLGRARSIRLSSNRNAMKEISRWLEAYRSGEAEPATALQGIQFVVASCGERA